MEPLAPQTSRRARREVVVTTAREPYARRRASARAEARARVLARTTRPLEPAQRARDVLVSSPRGRRRVGVVTVALVGSVAVHALVVLVGFAFGGLDVGRREEIQQTVRVELAPPPPPPPPPEPPQQPPADVDAPAPKPVPKPAPRPVAKAPEPPPPQAPPPKAPPPRVVGLSLESTTEAGNGPAFAVGNTRDGETARRAADAKNVPSVPGPGPAVETPPANATATRLPVAGVKYTPPKRTRAVDPDYPPTLKAQGIEADVPVMVSIDASGKVTSVRVLKPSGYPELDDAAKKSALATEYEPAQREGVAIPYTLSYTVKFRLETE